MRAAAIALPIVVLIVAGCVADDAAYAADSTPPAPGSRATIRDDKVHMDVPVPVFLVGFSPALGQSLERALVPLRLQSEGAIVPTARFEVHVPSAQWQADFDAFLATSAHPGNADLTGFSGKLLDGRRIEDHLAKTLPEVHPVPEGITSLVVLDTGLRGHAYHYEGDVGWREPVRTFGERHGLIVWDPFAEADPWVGTFGAHHQPATSVTAANIAAWVERATAIRALQMPIWPPTTLPCHALTVVLAVRGTALTPELLGLQPWEETLDLERIKRTFEDLTEDPVHVDLVVLQLPADDPVLELATRENNARVVTQTYLDQNFDAYHVAHEGCEPYLSLIVFGDLADQRTSSNGNAAMMTLSGRRISTSLVAENVRVMTEYVGYNQVWDESTAFERVGPGANPHEWFNWLVVHETGHLFGLPHPNYSEGDVAHQDEGFASTWNAMGYQMRRIVTQTSHLDNHNLQRNQAAAAILEAARGGDDAALQEALAAMSQFRWKDATRLATGG